MGLAVSLAAAACGSSPSRVLGGDSAEADWPAINEAVSQAVVRIQVTTCDGSGSGSGFYLDPSTIVSNRHVVADSTRLGIDRPADLGFASAAHTTGDGADVALIASPQPAAAALQLASRDPVPGDRIEVLGYPEGGELTISPGRVIDIVEDGRDAAGPMIHSDARVRPGNSGGPMINAQGQVVGLVRAIDLHEGDGMAIPVSALRRSLAAPRVPVPVTAHC